MTSDDSIRAASDRLVRAQEDRVPCAPVRDLIGTDDLDAAYAVQMGVVRRRLESGATVVGRKIGATSKAVQDQLGVDQPDFGYLLDDMDVSGHDPISMAGLLQPRVEAEVAFVLSQDVDPGDVSVGHRRPGDRLLGGVAPALLGHPDHFQHVDRGGGLGMFGVGGHDTISFNLICLGVIP